MPVRKDGDAVKKWWLKEEYDMVIVRDGGGNSQGGCSMKKSISNEVFKMYVESAESIKTMFLFTSEKVGSRILHSKWSLKKCLQNWESVKKTVDNKEMDCLGFLPRLSEATCNIIMEVVRHNGNSKVDTHTQIAWKGGSQFLGGLWWGKGKSIVNNCNIWTEKRNRGSRIMFTLSELFQYRNQHLALVTFIWT